MTDGYLSRDREHLARLQRERRKLYPRIDYMPCREAAAVLAARQAEERPGSAAGTNSAILDAIVMEWAALTGIEYEKVEAPSVPMTLAAAGPPNLFTLRPCPSRLRVRCGAKRHRDGEPCEALSEPGKRRCRFHGGRSTGPRTPEGKARVAQNLLRTKQNSGAGD